MTKFGSLLIIHGQAERRSLVVSATRSFIFFLSTTVELKKFSLTLQTRGAFKESHGTSVFGFRTTEEEGRLTNRDYLALPAFVANFHEVLF